MEKDTSGQLTVKVVQGRLTRDLELIGKQDPYVKLEYMGKRYKTRIHEDGGKEPVWGDVFEIALGSISDELNFECKDNEVIGARSIGSAVIKGSSLCINNGVRDWFTIYFEDKSAG